MSWWQYGLIGCGVVILLDGVLLVWLVYRDRLLRNARSSRPAGICAGPDCERCRREGYLHVVG
jgi:hypothetical protein